MNWNVILASQSPRRQQLLHEIGIKFTVVPSSDPDESYPSHLPPEEIPVFIARSKAFNLIPKLTPNDILITSDTIVWCNGEVIGKPTSTSDAKRILTQLSGRKHLVVTGVLMATDSKTKTFSACTDVYFRKLTEQEIDYYVDTFSPLDKAGAYGIQEWIGYIGVERIVGSYHNVMGLPVQRLYCELDSLLT